MGAGAAAKPVPACNQRPMAEGRQSVKICTVNMYLTAIVEEDTDNLREAVELLLATADADEIASRLKARIYVTHFEVSVGAA